jgi:hypothetical protein
MTTPTASTDHQDSRWPDELATYLGPGCFPASHDHLAATLIRRRAPSHLLWHLSLAPRTREFQSLEELVEQLGQLPQNAPARSLEPPT